jgi:hypothetical protein
MASLRTDIVLNPPSPIIRTILEHLATFPTDGPGYKPLCLSEYSTAETDRALALLFHAGLVNAFIKPSNGDGPLYHPSSLTPTGRRAVDQLAKQAVHPD